MNKQHEEPIKPKKNLFKDHKDFYNEINFLLERYQSVLRQKSTQTHLLFEMSMLVGIENFFYKHNFNIEVKNATSNNFIFSLSPNANPTNISYFSATKKSESTDFKYEIRHNVRIQSRFNNEIFFSPDYVVCIEGSLTSNYIPWYYGGKYPYYYIKSDGIMTFAEAKNYIPSPELVLNFVGIVNEFIPELIKNEDIDKRDVFTPALFISGHANPHMYIIKKSLKDRYRINILFQMFDFPTQLHSESSDEKIETF